MVNTIFKSQCAVLKVCLTKLVKNTFYSIKFAYQFLDNKKHYIMHEKLVENLGIWEFF